MLEQSVKDHRSLAQPLARGLKILAVDDSPSGLMVLSCVLAEDGHQVSTARSGEEAVRRFISDPPDVVLMDVVMPGMDGYEATARIKALSGRRWVPVIFLSALTDDAELVRGLEVGGDLSGIQAGFIVE